MHPADWLLDIVKQGIHQLVPEAVERVALERPKQLAHGDYATNIAMLVAKALKQAPQQLAQRLIDVMPKDQRIASISIAGPGFINIFLTPEARQCVVKTVLRQQEEYGRQREAFGALIKRTERVIVEYVSANPTGPLHVGHGRAAAVGEGVATLLEWQGYPVYREFYYNDAGVQIDNLVRSVKARIVQLSDSSFAFPEEGYHGDYIRGIAQAYVNAHPDDVLGNNIDQVRAWAISSLREEQDRDLKALGIEFDEYYLESSLYTDGKVDEAVARLTAQGYTYEHEGALWLKTTDWGDDKDRVMRKSDGTYTYFVPDVAYHLTKWQRGYQRAITELGADHHGSTQRVRAGLQAMGLGIPQGYPDYVLHQMVTVIRAGQEVKISKRAGGYVTVRDLIEEVGRDAVRFFFLMRKHDSQLVFDLDLAVSKSEENPVYYVQYAHARICSVLRNAKVSTSLLNVALTPLVAETERRLMLLLEDFPVMLQQAAEQLSPHLIPFYLREVAAAFHSYYNDQRILVEETALREARLALLQATAQVLRNGLGLMDVSSPEEM
jgi:arginyl-tRNA synthetase